MKEIKPTFDFYDKTYLKSYNLDKSIQYQLNLLDSLDVYTRKHCENVAAIVCNLCRKMHLSKGFTIYCVTCAFLHDIGKLFIPSKILQKNDKLTPEEYEIMKTHTTLGYNLCIKDIKLRPYYAGAYYHHEALDGSGYPQGLTKKDIPFEAQIIRIADEYDALVNKRQYKSHIGISDSLKIIIENTKPSTNSSEKNIHTHVGKNNKKIVKKLISVVIDDIEYEISYTLNYVNYLKKELNRYEKIGYYIKKLNASTKENDKIYYQEYINSLLKSNENMDNFLTLYQEHINAYKSRKDTIDNLFKEIKIIKRLKV